VVLKKAGFITTEISRVLQQMYKMMSFRHNTCTQPSTHLINGFVDQTLWNRWRNGDVIYATV